MNPNNPLKTRTLEKGFIGGRFFNLLMLVALVIFMAGCVISGVGAEEEKARILSGKDYQLVKVADGFNQPIYVTHAGDRSDRLFIVEQVGAIWILENGSIASEPFLNIAAKIRSGGERGLLGLAFDPNYKDNGYFFVHYSDSSGDTVLARYSVSPDSNKADPNSEVIVLKQDQPFGNHNGGSIAFGPDGYLYLGLGDGGSGGDPLGSGQNTNTLLGKLLRLDVSVLPYRIPSDNPFVAGGGLPEVWAYGLRNPWRFDFDRLTGDLYIGDVGQNAWEEIDFQAAGEKGGGNYGWNVMEGDHCFLSFNCNSSSFVAPVAEYDHRKEDCSVTGGYVYRGEQINGLNGVYLYGDYCTGRVWGLWREADGDWANTLLLDTSALISSFGEDESGEVYIVDHGGTIYRLQQRD